MDLNAWKTAAHKNLVRLAEQINDFAPGMIYGALAAAALLPLATAASQTDAQIALVSLIGNLGGNLLANQLQTWQERSEPELANKLSAQAKSDAALRAALDALLHELAAPQLVRDRLNADDKAWFEMMLQRGLAQIGSNLTVQGDYIQAVVKDSTNVAIGKNIKQIVKIVNYYYQQTDPQADAERQRRQTVLFQTYLTSLMGETGTLDLSGVDRATASNPEAAKLELAAVYTALYTLGAQTSDEEINKDSARTLRVSGERERQSALAFVNQNSYAALLGDPGSGKTTFANFLALCLAGELLENKQANLARLGDEWRAGAQLPVRVVLRNFAAQLPATGATDHEQAGDLLWHYITRRLGASLQDFVPLLQWHLLEAGGLLVLDGLDEVPEAQARREVVKAAVLDFRRQFPRIRILLTSRTYAYQRQQWRLPEFAEAVLAPFDDEQINDFVDHWYAHMAQVRPHLSAGEAQGRAALLKASIERNHYLRDLAVRPLLLTLMASLHAWRNGTLPDDREQLYAESVELLLDIWERPKTVLDATGTPIVQSASMAEWLRVSQRQVVTVLEKLAYTVHATQATLTGTADIAEEKLVGALLAAADNPDLRPGRVIEYVRDRAGLLINRGERVYSFPHRTFQEYLAARYLTENRFPQELVRLVRGDPERWREVLLLAGAKVARGAPFAAWSLATRLCPRMCDPNHATDADWWAALLAGQLLVETHIYAKIDPEADISESDTLERVRAWLVQLVSGNRLPPVDRAAAGVALGRLGDPRPGVGVKAGLPDISWIPIEAGPFIMGSDKHEDQFAQDDEQPQFTCQLIQQPYRISCYPITVAQYRTFVEDKGYQAKKWWTKAGWQWREQNSISGPRKFGSVFETPNHPQTGVSWYEAVAFCAWLTGGIGFLVRLPSEAEWERAARHTDGRIYPWGGEFAATRCNMRDTGIGATSAVGIFPNGNAESGAADMSGNVWEWCSTKWLGDYKGYANKVNDDLEGEARRVVRGGAWNYVHSSVRCAYRHLSGGPDDGDDNISFRVVAPGC